MGRITDTCAEYKRVIWRFIVPDGVSNKMAVGWHVWEGLAKARGT